MTLTNFRAIQMTLQSSSDLATLSHLALCAGFDAVARTTDDHVEAYVSRQDGIMKQIDHIVYSAHTDMYVYLFHDAFFRIGFN